MSNTKVEFNYSTIQLFKFSSTKLLLLQISTSAVDTCHNWTLDPYQFIDSCECVLLHSHSAVRSVGYLLGHSHLNPQIFEYLNSWRDIWIIESNFQAWHVCHYRAVWENNFWRFVWNKTVQMRSHLTYPNHAWNIRILSLGYLNWVLLLRQLNILRSYFGVNHESVLRTA